MTDLNIKSIGFKAVALELESPPRTAIHNVSHAYCLLVSITTNNGLVGEGYSFCFEREKLKVISAMSHILSRQFEGENIHNVAARWAQFVRDNNFYGQAGITALAMNPLDIACWDLIGKAAGQPLARLFGSASDSIRAYASHGLWLPASRDELEAEARAFIDAGYKGMKLRLGSKRWQDDVSRIETVRAVIGEDVALMVDFNQGLSGNDAMRICCAIDQMNLAWIEEPVATWDDAASAALAHRLDTPIASGETEFTSYGIRRMVERKCADIYMPDLQRMGGYTEIRKVMAYLETLDIPISPHLFSEQSLHLAAASTHVSWLEHVSWFEGIYREKTLLNAEGNIDIPDRPGIGYTFNWDALDSSLIKL